MILNFNLNDVALKIGKLLAADYDIQAFCKNNCGKDLICVSGTLDPQDSPSNDDAPYVFVYEIKKSEGDGDSKAHYYVNIGFAISAEPGFVEEDGVKYQLGYKLACDFEKMIQDVINGYRQISHVGEVDIFKPVEPGSKIWAGNMPLRFDIEQTLGLGQTQEF